MTTVTLHGDLADKFQAQWELLIDQPREAIAAINANTAGRFYQYLREIAEKTKHTMAYRFLINGQDHRDLQDLYLLGPIETIDIIPVMAGSAGLWQTILGVVLIIVGVVVAVVAGWTGIGLQAGIMIGLAGLSMVVGGISQMLSPSPSFNPTVGRSFQPMSQNLGGGEEKGSHKETSYLFSGAANTTQQGNPVPVIYGEMVTGSHLVSIGMSTAFTPLNGENKAPIGPPGWVSLPVWDTIRDQTVRRALLEDRKRIKAMPAGDLELLANTFHLQGPFTTKALRARLLTLHYVFWGFRQTVLEWEARAVWRILPGPPPMGTTEKKAKAKDYMLSIANYYVMNP